MAARLIDGLVGEAVLVRPSCTSFEATVEGLVQRLVAQGSLPQAVAAGAVRSICEREALSSTAMVDIGVSIPHARIAGVDGIIAALAVSPQAVYQVADGLPISIVALVLSSPDLSGEHLNFLASLSMLLQSEQTRQRLRSAADANEVIQLVRSSDTARS